jgi:hypothetical protein
VTVCSGTWFVSSWSSLSHGWWSQNILQHSFSVKVSNHTQNFRSWWSITWSRNCPHVMASKGSVYYHKGPPQVHFLRLIHLVCILRLCVYIFQNLQEIITVCAVCGLPPRLVYASMSLLLRIRKLGMKECWISGRRMEKSRTKTSSCPTTV